MRLFVTTAILGISASSALAGFTGQPIQATLVPGSIVTGNTIGAPDNNDGFTSGDHFFNLWPGPDHVYKLNFPGGDLTATLTHGAGDDIDLFVYRPSNLDDSGDYNITNLLVSSVTIPAAAPGMYYIVLDSDTAANAGPYTLAISAIPEPASLGALSVVGMFARRRR